MSNIRYYPHNANSNWPVTDELGNINLHCATLTVLMDIRAELRKLNGLLGCYNFTGIPGTLKDIKRNTTKPRRKKKGSAK